LFYQRNVETDVKKGKTVKFGRRGGRIGGEMWTRERIPKERLALSYRVNP